MGWPVVNPGGRVRGLLPASLVMAEVVKLLLGTCGPKLATQMLSSPYRRGRKRLLILLKNPLNFSRIDKLF